MKFSQETEKHHTQKIDLDNNAHEFIEEKQEITYYKIGHNLERRIRTRLPNERVTEPKR